MYIIHITYVRYRSPKMFDFSYQTIYILNKHLKTVMCCAVIYNHVKQHLNLFESIVEIIEL